MEKVMLGIEQAPEFDVLENIKTKKKEE